MKAEIISKQVFAEYRQFATANINSIGGEGFYKSVDTSKEASQLLQTALHSDAQKSSYRLSYCADIGFKISIACITTCLLTLSWNRLRKFALWLINYPQKAILIFATGIFLSTWLIPPWISSGRIRYDFILTPLWNGSRIFWALLLVEWTIILLPLALIYRRMSDKAKMR